MDFSQARETTLLWTITFVRILYVYGASYKPRTCVLLFSAINELQPEDQAFYGGESMGNFSLAGFEMVLTQGHRINTQTTKKWPWSTGGNMTVRIEL